MRQPLPGAACWHQMPAGLANSSIWGTLQHIMQEPQARPGTSCGATTPVDDCAVSSTASPDQWGLLSIAIAAIQCAFCRCLTPDPCQAFGPQRTRIWVP